MRLHCPTLTVVLMSALATAAFASSPKMPGLQLWSLRGQLQTDPLAALDTAKRFGFTEVETAGTAGMTAAAFRAELDRRGLTAIAAHVQYGDLEKDVQAVIRDVQTLGAKVAFCPWIPHEGTLDAATVERAAASFNTWGAAFRAAGIRFGYHLHGYEFVPGPVAGETLFDDLVRRTDPGLVALQLDVFWAYYAGADPVALLGKHPGRWVSLHVKDIRQGVVPVPGSPRAPETDKVAVGAGQFDWIALFGAARRAGVGQYIIEDETPAPLENIPASLAFLRGLELPAE